MNIIYSFIKENELTIVAPKISTTCSVTQAMAPTIDIKILRRIIYWIPNLK